MPTRRQPKGSSKGGQFAPSPRPEPPECGADRIGSSKGRQLAPSPALGEPDDWGSASDERLRDAYRESDRQCRARDDGFSIDRHNAIVAEGVRRGVFRGPSWRPESPSEAADDDGDRCAGCDTPLVLDDLDAGWCSSCAEKVLEEKLGPNYWIYPSHQQQDFLNQAAAERLRIVAPR